MQSTQQFVSGDITDAPAGSNGSKAVNLSSSATGQLIMTASWASTDIGGAKSIGALMVLDGSGTAAGTTMASGQTFNSSQWNTNQNVSATYIWAF